MTATKVASEETMCRNRQAQLLCFGNALCSVVIHLRQGDGEARQNLGSIGLVQEGNRSELDREQDFVDRSIRDSARPTIVISCAILALDRAAVSRSTKGYFES